MEGGVMAFVTYFVMCIGGLLTVLSIACFLTKCRDRVGALTTLLIGIAMLVVTGYTIL